MVFFVNKEAGQRPCPSAGLNLHNVFFLCMGNFVRFLNVRVGQFLNFFQERGMGQLAGARQSGGVETRFTDFTKDDDLIVASRKAAIQLIESDPQLTGANNREIRKRLERRYERAMELFRVG